MAEPDLTPPEGVRAAAKRGIELVAQGKAGDGFMPATLQRARKIAAGQRLTPRHVRRMHSFFSRHAVDRRPDWGKPGAETPGYVAWMAWGGDLGASWAAKVAAQLDRAQEAAVTPTSDVVAVGDLPFEVRGLPGDLVALSSLLEDVTERSWQREEAGLSEGHDPELVDLIARARAIAQSLADELAVDGEPTAQLDAMVAHLTAMLRAHLADGAASDREHEVAMATYADEERAAEAEVELSDDEELDDEEMSGDWGVRQLALYEMLEQVAGLFGPFDKGVGPDGLHYMAAAENPFAAQGLRCGNCIFYEGGGCELLAEDEAVEPGAVCKMWIVPAADIREAAGDKSTPAPPEDRRYGSRTNARGSADTGASVDFSGPVIRALTTKVEQHNDGAEHRTSLAALKAVYRRGAGAYSVSHRPGMTRNQWAMGRVNAFLRLLKSGRPDDADYVTDNDLLPASHPRSTKS